MDPTIDDMLRQQIRQAIAAYEATRPQPEYSCPTCRDPIIVRPTKELKSMACAIDTLAQLPVPIDGLAIADGRPPVREDGVWDQFFRRV